MQGMIVCYILGTDTKKLTRIIFLLRTPLSNCCALYDTTTRVPIRHNFLGDDPYYHPQTPPCIIAQSECA